MRGLAASPTLLSGTNGSSLVARLELVHPMNDALKNVAPALIALLGTVLVVRRVTFAVAQRSA